MFLKIMPMGVLVDYAVIFCGKSSLIHYSTTDSLSATY